APFFDAPDPKKGYGPFSCRSGVFMTRVTTLLTSTALVLITAVVSSAQVGGGGSIQGTVLDTSNAAVPGATVTATNVATGIDTIRQTTGAGVYAVTPLPPGQY